MKRAKGMRDFLPPQMMQREKVFSVLAETYREFGFQPLETPALELLSTLRAKSGEEIAGQLFEIRDSDFGMRFDLTVPLSRVAANTSFPKPFKRYQIGPVWRREEPQKGRFREFWQADADIIGSSSMRVEAELLEMASTALRRLGLCDFKILLNNRRILNSLLDHFGISEKRGGIFRTLDKIDKIGYASACKSLEPLLGESAGEIMPLFNLEGTNEEKLAEFGKYSPEGTEEVRQILELFPDFSFEPTLVRGLGYYSGPVFEFKGTGEYSGSFAGGGRYDGLLELYGKGAPAAGVSLGVERILLLLGENMEKKTYTDVFVATLPGQYQKGIEVAKELRKERIPAETDLMGRSLKKQLDYARSLRIPWVMVIGEKEAEKNQVTLRDMDAGEEETLPIAKAIMKIRRI
ncbi:histidine--tRNA ligase [Candidatus Micrarchaeota archaeon]|nr:histidine--tRNA ligase [Candidatus Micrarchaeota archaeon]